MKYVHRPPQPPISLQETMARFEVWPNRKVRRAVPAWLKKLSKTSDWESQYILLELIDASR